MKVSELKEGMLVVPVEGKGVLSGLPQPDRDRVPEGRGQRHSGDDGVFGLPRGGQLVRQHAEGIQLQTFDPHRHDQRQQARTSRPADGVQHTCV